MSHEYRRVVLASLPLLSSLVLAAPMAMADEPLKVYGLRLNDPDAPIFTSFTEATGIAIELVQMSMDELTAAFDDGGEPPVDVMMVVDSGNITGQQERGLFQAIDSATLEERVPAELRDLEGGWSGYATRARVIYVNPDKVDWVPSHYEDLADPRVQGLLCLGSGTSAYNASWVGSMVAHHGEEAAEEWAAAVVDNLARPTGGRDGELLQALAEPGECAVTVANHYYYLRMLLSDDGEERELAEAVDLIWPNQEGDGAAGRGAYRNVAGFAVANGTSRADDARRFLEHTASDTVQLDVAEGIFYPVVEGSAESVAEQRLGAAKTDAIPMRELGQHHDTARQILARVGWE